MQLVNESNHVSELFGEREVRWYQGATRSAVVSAIIDEGLTRPLIVLPTGSGKTVTIAITVADPVLSEFIGVPSDRKTRVLFCAHLHRLLSQAENTFADASNVEIRTQSAFSPLKQETVDWADLIVLDEAHHEAMASIQYQLDKVKNKVIIGLTATNNRPDGLLLKFDKEVAIISREVAVQQGWLAETSIWTVINRATLCGRSTEAYTVDVCYQLIEKYHHIMGPTMVFVRKRKEIDELVKRVSALGIKVVGLTNQTPKQLEQVLKQYESGEIQMLVNCKKIGEGVDCPDTQSVILGCTIGSIVDLNQRIGRASRPNSECMVFELINPLNPDMLTALDVVGVAKSHKLVYENTSGELIERDFQQAS